MATPSLDPAAAELALEHLPVPVVLLDASRLVVRLNAAARAAFGDLPAGTALDVLGSGLEVVPIADSGLSIACLLSADLARIAALGKAAGESGSLAHDIKNVGTAVSLSLRAVAHALEEDEQAVLTDLHDRLQGIERRIRCALTGL